MPVILNAKEQYIDSVDKFQHLSAAKNSKYVRPVRILLHYYLYRTCKWKLIPNRDVSREGIFRTVIQKSETP